MEYIMDCHSHTIVSGHAYCTIDEYAKEASKKGLELIAITDHAPAMPGSTHAFYFHNMGILPNKLYGVEILKGVEVNIIDKEGNLDLEDEVLGKLDIVIASLHPPCIEFGTKQENTKTILSVLKNKNVNILGHPDDSRYAFDIEKIVKAAKENKVLIEINNSSLKPTSFREGSKGNYIKLLKECKKQKTNIIINSDAHFYDAIGYFPYAQALIEEVDFPIDLIINTSVDKLKKFLIK